jgi:hypothetical protein
LSHVCAEVYTLEARSNSQKQTMFVDDIKLMENPKLMTLSSLVWCDIAKRLYSVWPQVLYYSTKLGFVIRGVSPNTKIGITPQCSVSIRAEKEHLL